MCKTQSLAAILVAASVWAAVAQAPQSELTGEFGEVDRTGDLGEVVSARVGETFEYMLVPFHHTNFRTRRSFENWLDDIGAEGWVSIAHFPALNPRDHQRLFMRRVGGPALVINFDIKQHRVDLETDSVEVWVPEFARLGRQGKFPVWTFKQRGKNYVVTETRTLDGVLQTLSWENVLAGKSQRVGPTQYKRAARRLASDAYVPETIGFSADRSDYYVVGLAETTPGRVNTVKLRFGTAKLSTRPNQWKRLINRHARRGYHLADVQLADDTGTNFILVFAQIKINGKATRRTCVVEPLRLNDVERMMDRLNTRGAAGYEQVILTFGGGFNSFQFVLCRDM